MKEKNMMDKKVKDSEEQINDDKITDCISAIKLSYKTNSYNVSVYATDFVICGNGDLIPSDYEITESGACDDPILNSIIQSVIKYSRFTKASFPVISNRLLKAYKMCKLYGDAKVRIGIKLIPTECNESTIEDIKNYISL